MRTTEPDSLHCVHLKHHYAHKVKTTYIHAIRAPAMNTKPNSDACLIWLLLSPVFLSSSSPGSTVLCLNWLRTCLWMSRKLFWLCIFVLTFCIITPICLWINKLQNGCLSNPIEFQNTLPWGTFLSPILGKLTGSCLRPENHLHVIMWATLTEQITYP